MRFNGTIKDLEVGDTIHWNEAESNEVYALHTDGVWIGTREQCHGLWPSSRYPELKEHYFNMELDIERPEV